MCWLITHIFPAPARAVKGKRNVLVSLSTLSNQNRELYKDVVLSVHECTESRTILFAASLVIIHNIHIKMKTQIQFKAYSLKGLIKHYQTFWCEINLLIVHNSLRRNWGWMNSGIQKNNKSPWSMIPRMTTIGLKAMLDHFINKIVRDSALYCLITLVRPLAPSRLSLLYQPFIVLFGEGAFNFPHQTCLKWKLDQDWKQPRCQTFLKNEWWKIEKWIHDGFDNVWERRQGKQNKAQ